MSKVSTGVGNTGMRIWTPFLIKVSENYIYMYLEKCCKNTLKVNILKF